MSKLDRLKRRLAVLAGGIVILTGLILVLGSPSAAQRTADLPPLLPGFASANAASVELRQAPSLLSGGKERVVRLARTAPDRSGATSWVVASAHDYPANQERVDRLFSELAAARVGSEATRRSEAFTDYVEDGAWVEVTVKDATGGTLAALGVGKSSGPAYGGGDTYMRLDGPPRVVRVKGFGADLVKAMPEAWLLTRLFNDLESAQVEAIEVVQKVEVDGKPSTRTLSFTKRPAEAPAAPAPGEPPPPPPERGWDMTLPEIGPASRLDVEDLVRAFTGLLFEDVVDRVQSGEGDAKYGFDAPEIVAKVTLAPAEPGKRGRVAILTLGRKDPATNVWYARRSPDTWVFTLKDNDWSVGRFRNDPSKYKATPPPAPETPKPPEPAPAAPAPEGGSPDGPAPAPGPAQPAPAPPDAPKPDAPPPEQPQPDQPKPEQPKPDEPKPDEPKPEEPKPSEPK